MGENVNWTKLRNAQNGNQRFLVLKPSFRNTFQFQAGSNHPRAPIKVRNGKDIILPSSPACILRITLPAFMHSH